MTIETRTTHTRADLFREINKQLRRAEREAEQRRRREYKPARPARSTAPKSRRGYTKPRARIS